MRTKEEILSKVIADSRYFISGNIDYIKLDSHTKQATLEVLIDIRDNLNTTNEKLERVRDKLAGVAQNISLR